MTRKLMQDIFFLEKKKNSLQSRIYSQGLQKPEVACPLKPLSLQVLLNELYEASCLSMRQNYRYPIANSEKSNWLLRPSVKE